MTILTKNLLPPFLLDWCHRLWPLFGALVYRFPSRRIKVIGITGTNGKTTVTHLVSEILESAGYRVASISSLRFKIGGEEWKNELKMTMPGRMEIQKFLRQAVDARCQYVVLEVTSEGIKQHRHNFIDFDVAVFTNLTPEHIERHGGFENYKKAKGELFKRARTCIVNLDDANAGYFSNLCKGKKYGYSVKSNTIKLTITLPGEFNLSNALAAAYVGLSQGVDMEIIKKALEEFRGVPGRMEVVVREPCTVIVDYAHTPDALEKVYKTIKANYKLICVLGAAGGGRDKWKRPEMGRIAAQYCDRVILTDEDPYDEDPRQIIEEIKKGIPNTRYQILDTVIDRKEAIKKALQLASLREVSRRETKQNTIVIITGKGAEPWLMTKDGKIPWDDREIVREVIRALPWAVSKG